MAEITYKGTPVRTVGELPAVGSKAPDFELVGADLSPISLSDFAQSGVLLPFSCFRYWW